MLAGGRGTSPVRMDIFKFSTQLPSRCDADRARLQGPWVELKVETRMADHDQISDRSADEDRRRFLATCGKFAAITPPAITMLLSTSLNSTAIARSGAKGNNGFGNGGGDGSPNGKDDTNR
jgi:hypothetical protein